MLRFVTEDKLEGIITKRADSSICRGSTLELG
jgi:hypothetical protein